MSQSGRKLAFINPLCNFLQIKFGINQTSTDKFNEGKLETYEQKLHGVVKQSVEMFCSFKDSPFYIHKVLFFFF
jgi:hypothetical protein